MDATQLDVIFISNENTNTLDPQVLITEFTFIVSELLMKNVDFVKKSGLTEQAKESREKLLKLLECSELFNVISTQNAALKLRNRNLCIELQRVKGELNEIKRQEKLAYSI